MADQAGRSPVAQLFIDCWREAAKALPSDRSTATPMGCHFATTAVEIGSQEDAATACAGLQALMAKHKTNLDRLGATLGVMAAIDTIFLRIHPRSLLLGPGAVKSLLIPSWLRDLRDERLLSGIYLDDGDLRLIPRGPLLRASRGKDACAADYLSDRFSSLACAPSSFLQEQRPIAVRMEVMGRDLLDGVPPPRKAGHERMAFFAVAEEAADLNVQPVVRAKKIFACYGPAKSLDVAERVAAGLKVVGSVDIALAGELVLSEDGVEQISDALRTSKAGPNVLVAGSYNSAEQHGGQPYNEAVVMNGAGAILWRQRKIWPANIAATDARKLKLVRDSYKDRVSEDNASGDELVIADLDGFGRCVVFICQDIKLDLVELVLKAYHPDWVFMPILDHGFAKNRWAHQQAVKLSYETQCRFVGVTSTSLSYLYRKTAPLTVGMAVGPSNPEEDDDLARASAIVGPDPKSKPSVAIIEWRSGDFEQFNLPA